MQSWVRHKSVQKPLRVGKRVVGCSREVSKDSTMKNTNKVLQFKGEEFDREKDQGSFYRRETF